MCLPIHLSNSRQFIFSSMAYFKFVTKSNHSFTIRFRFIM